MSKIDKVMYSMLVSVLVVYTIFAIAYLRKHNNSQSIKAEVGTESIYNTCSKKEELKELQPLEELMPQFAIITNADNTFQIQFLSHESTNWSVVDCVFSNEYKAEYIIEMTKLELELRYKIGKSIADGFRDAAKAMK